MPASRDSLVVNHRVALSGTPMRAATVGHHLGYIDRRPGAVRSEDLDQEARRDRDELLAYIDGRPGAARGDGGALFSQLGDVSLAEAREEVAKGQGALLRTVVSVRREDAEALGLDTREGWERYLRANWQQSFAQATGVPEHRVRWVAAVHVNHRNSVHAHVISWDAGQRDPWDSILDKRRMEAARRQLTDAALAPELDRLKRVRTLARDAAVEAVRAADLSDVAPSVGLPKDGSLKYAHLKRYHPDVAARVDAVSRRAVADSPDATAAVAAHRDAVRRMAELHGLEGPLADEYETKAEADLTLRLRNATISALVPDRRARPAHERLLAPGPATGERAADDRGEPTRAGHDEPADRGEPHAADGERVSYEELGWDLSGRERRRDDPAWATGPVAVARTASAPRTGDHGPAVDVVAPAKGDALAVDDALARLSLDDGDPRLERAFRLWEEHVAEAEMIRLAGDPRARRLVPTAEGARADLDLALSHPALLPMAGPEDEARHAIRAHHRERAVATARERLADALDGSASPSRLRRRERAVTEELRSTLGRAASDGRDVDVEAELGRCPSVARAAAKGAVDVAALASELVRSGGGDGHDTGSDAARALLTSPAIPLVAKRVARALEGASARIDARIDRFAERAQAAERTHVAERTREVIERDVGIEM